MKVEAGDVVSLKLTGRVKGGKVFENSGEKPAIVVVGKGRLIPGLDSAIIGMEPGQKKTIEVPPEKGYGKRDNNLVKLVPVSVFKKSGIKPVPGMVVDIDGFPARVLSVSGGRVQVDFNHELAGKTLEFDVEVLEIYKKDQDKAEALAKKYFKDGVIVKANDEFEITAKEDVLLARDYLEKKVFLIKELMVLGKPVKWTEVYKA